MKPTLLHHLLEQGVSAHPHATALLYKKLEISYAELGEEVTRLSSLLVHNDAEPGDRIAPL